ncbi:MAG: hypothetical protein IPM82_32665 [Saprospiraceae bacterium]|nr:hypothetical protein [Saprospiraceae bacterium]
MVGDFENGFTAPTSLGRSAFLGRGRRSHAWRGGGCGEKALPPVPMDLNDSSVAASLPVLA